MGDFFSPKRRDVVDRLRRRIELYRSRQNWSRSRYEPGINGIYDQQRQDTLLLHQKWMECKAKKAAKHTKAPKDFGSQSDHRAGQPLPKLKRKLDTSSSVNTSGASEESKFFEDRDSLKAKVPCTQKQEDKVLPSVSVQIVQQISAQQDQTIQTNVTVSSTVKGSTTTANNTNHPTATGGAGAGTTATQTSTNIHTSTNIECKQEPQDNPCNGPSNLNPFGIDDVDELQAILETLEKEEGEIPPDLMKELDKLDKLGESCDSVNSDHDPDADFKDQLFGTGSGKGSPSLFPDSSTPLSFDGSAGGDATANQNMAGLNQTNQTFNQAPSAGLPVGGTPPASGILNMGEPTGPAAETLKQMAAQHQIPENGHFSMKQTMTYNSESSVTENFVPPARRQSGMTTPGSGAYPRGYPNQQTMPQHANGQQDSMFSYSQQQTQPQAPGPNHHQSRMTRPTMDRQPASHMSIPPMHIKQDPSLTYGGTKPLSHFTHPSLHGDAMSTQQTQPSSLQQLQEQVHSHFPQGPPNQQGPTSGPQPQARVQLTQNQQIQMSQMRGQHIQMAQQQQLQMHSGPNGLQAQQMSISQQQSFSMTQQQQQQQHVRGMPTSGQQQHPNIAAQAGYMNEQMKMQMMQQKMRQQRLREQQMMQQRQAEMQHGYMNRPPPEYKVGAAGGHMPPGTDTAGYPRNTASGSSNPLQTMQNMVNQTSQVAPPVGSSQNTMHTIVKQEAGQPVQGMEHASRQQHMGGPQMLNTSHAAHLPVSLPAQQAPSMNMGQNFASQRQPPVYQSHSLSNGTAHSQVKSAGAPAYTSAIMRGQRPPNVNVGPEGLNISQQRVHTSDWPRSAMMQQNSSAQQIGRMPGPRGMHPNNMMSFTGYAGGQNPTAGMGMTGMPMQGRPQQRPNPGHMASTQQEQERAVMMQQQAQQGMMQQQAQQGMMQQQVQQGMMQQGQMMHHQQQQQQQQHMQQMHMRHHNTAHGQMTNVNMSQSVSMTTRTAQEFPANSAGTTNDFPLDFLDGPQAGGTDFFDSNNADFNLIDEIFGK